MLDHRLVTVYYEDRIKASENQRRFMSQRAAGNDQKRTSIFTMIAQIFSSKEKPETKPDPSVPHYKLEEKFSSR